MINKLTWFPRLEFTPLKFTAILLILLVVRPVSRKYWLEKGQVFIIGQWIILRWKFTNIEDHRTIVNKKTSDEILGCGKFVSSFFPPDITVAIFFGKFETGTHGVVQLYVAELSVHKFPLLFLWTLRRIYEDFFSRDPRVYLGGLETTKLDSVQRIYCSWQPLEMLVCVWIENWTGN